MSEDDDDLLSSPKSGLVNPPTPEPIEVDEVELEIHPSRAEELCDDADRIIFNKSIYLCICNYPFSHTCTQNIPPFVTVDLLVPHYPFIIHFLYAGLRSSVEKVVSTITVILNIL